MGMARRWEIMAMEQVLLCLHNTRSRTRSGEGGFTRIRYNGPRIKAKHLYYRKVREEEEGVVVVAKESRQWRGGKGWLIKDNNNDKWIYFHRASPPGEPQVPKGLTFWSLLPMGVLLNPLTPSPITIFNFHEKISYLRNKNTTNVYIYGTKVCKTMFSWRKMNRESN